VEVIFCGRKACPLCRRSYLHPAVMAIDPLHEVGRCVSQGVPTCSEISNVKVATWVKRRMVLTERPIDVV